MPHPAKSVTVVMFHYVRDLARSRFPAIKGLDADRFAGQIDYIERHYSVISGEQLMRALDGEALPQRPLLLTFDDGYRDHFDTVFPVLDRRGLSACFFPPARAVVEHQLLDVNKVHFILASAPDPSALADRLLKRIGDLGQDRAAVFDLKPPEHYWNEFAKPSRYDPAEIVFCKRVLQRGLPPEARCQIADELFAEFVGQDQESFAYELYMTPDQLRVLSNHNMLIGSHGYDHSWLDTLEPAEQAKEIDRSLDFLRSLGINLERWLMCYPYGAHNASLLELLRERKCVGGLTTRVAVANLEVDDTLALPRLDTTDLPCSGDAEVSQWTAQAGT